MRGKRSLLVAAALLLLAVIAAGVLLARREPLREWSRSVTGEEDAWESAKGALALGLLSLRAPALDLAPDAPVDHLGGNPYGVNTFLQLEADPENVRRSAAAMRDAGIGWARQQFPWEDIEIHGPGDFEDRRHEPYRSAWDKYDRIVGTAEDHGVELLVRLDDPPNWAYAGDEPVTHLGPPDDLAHFGDFVAAVADRYCGRVRYYQIWNEPNIFPEWGERDVDPAGYAELLSLAARRAREACDDVVIVSAALAPTTEPGGRNMDDLKYLDALYEAGWADAFDVLAVNAFGLWTGPTDRRVSPDRANFSRAMLARDVMVRHADAEKPVWITEMGWDSPPEDMAAPYGRVTEDLRAEYTVAAYERMTEEWPWVGPGFLWFLRRPNRDWHQQPQGYFRILEPEWAETPTYRALVDLGRQPAMLHRGRHAPSDRALRYSGPWRDRSIDGPIPQRVGTAGAEVQFAFDGTGFQVELLEPPAEQTRPEVYLVVDGDTSTLRPEPADGRMVLAAGDLAQGEHVVIMRVDDGEVWLDEIVVSAPGREPSLAPLWSTLALIAVLVGALGAAGALLWRARAHADPT